MGTIVIERVTGAGVLVLRGEQDAYGAPRIARELASLLGEPLGIVVDLSGAVFVESVILLELLRAKTAAAEAGVGFVLQMGAETGTYVRRVFEITSLTAVFAVASTRADALAAARAGIARPDLRVEPA